jgi:serine protease AprX
MVQVLELDPMVDCTQMDNVGQDIALPIFHRRHPNLTGAGVTVAVLDSGIDTRHPYLNVFASIETCGESVDIPGDHGTHCAGSIASRDQIFRGVAPDVIRRRAAASPRWCAPVSSPRWRPA